MSSLAAKFANQFTSSARSNSALGNHMWKSSSKPRAKALKKWKNLDYLQRRNRRLMGPEDIGCKRCKRLAILPKPPQWHCVVVHNESLGAYAVQQLVKNSSVYVEGDIEIRVYNKGITGEVMRMPEICVRSDGKVRLIKPGESTTNIPFDELREGL